MTEAAPRSIGVARSWKPMIETRLKTSSCTSIV
jgi:hypothetical protein